jgi:hypothetical protein
MKTTRPVSQVDGQDTSNVIPDDEAAIPADYGDHQERTVVSKGFLPQAKQRLETGDELLHEQLYISGNELRQQEEDYPTAGTEVTISPDPSYTKYHQYPEFRPVWDYYEDDKYDSTSYAVGPGDGGSVSDYELNLHPFINFGTYVWSTVTSVSKRILSSVMVDQCYELVVCEAHRVGRAWGESGMLLASGLR